MHTSRRSGVEPRGRRSCSVTKERPAQFRLLGPQPVEPSRSLVLLLDEAGVAKHDRGMRLMLDDPDLRAIPRKLRGLGGQAGNEAEQVQRYLLPQLCL
jgi:hypothetical protein